MYSAVLAACSTDGHGFKPRTSTNACGCICRYVDQKGWAAMLTSIQSAGVTPEVNLRITQGRKHIKGIYPGFETSADVTKSPKQGCEWPHEKDLCPQKNCKKNFKKKRAKYSFVSRL